MKDKIFKVLGQNAKGEWIVQHPSGLECGGIWHSHADAQADCDKWNARTSSWQLV